MTDHLSPEETTYRLSINDKLDMILKEVRHTNGRVRSLEVWRGFILGGLTIMSLVIIPIGYLLINHP